MLVQEAGARVLSEEGKIILRYWLRRQCQALDRQLPTGLRVTLLQGLNVLKTVDNGTLGASPSLNLFSVMQQFFMATSF